MLLEELILRHSDKELDDWASVRKEEIRKFYDSTLSRRPGAPVEWGFMDSDKHPVHPLWEEHRFVQYDAEEKPGDLVMGPNGNDWELVAMTPHSVGTDETPIIDRKACPTLKHSNSGWDSTLRDLSRVGRPDGTKGEFQRPSGNWIFDLVKEGYGFMYLEAAHVLAHLNGRSLVESVARLHLCREFGLPVFADGRDGLDALGIKVVASIDMRRPTGFVPVMELGTDTEIIVFCGVHVEPHPKSFEESDDWLEVNRWSCEPSISCIAGFEYPSFVTKSPIVGRFPGSRKNPLYMVPVACMLPAKELEIAIAVQIRSMVMQNRMPTQLTFLNDWMRSGLFKSQLMATPPLPCKDCLRLNTQAEGHPLRPKSQRPDSLRNADPEVRKEWEEYEEKMDKIFKIVDKASCYAEGQSLGHTFAKRQRRMRRAAYNKRTELENRIASLDRRADRYLLKGNIDKAAEHRNKANELRKQLEELLNGLYTATVERHRSVSDVDD